MPASDDDSGLLAPVWAATPVQQATSERAWLQAMLDAEAALARAQAALGLVPEPAAAQITAAAKAGSFDLAALAARSRASGSPVVALVAELSRAVGPDAADHVHLGSTSQDILDTATMLVVTRAAKLLLADLDRTTAALARLAALHRDTPMAGRTLGQHAVPTTFGLKVAGWLTGIAGAAGALRQLIDGGLPVQLGGAAGTLAGYLHGAPEPAADELPALFARELGLRAPTLPWHTDRLPVAAIGSVLALVTGALGKLAIDVQTLSRQEIAEVAEPAGPGRGGSSAMPHKRNPVLATLIRSAALQVPQLAATLALAMLAEDERSAGPWQAEWPALRDCVRLAGGAAHTAAELAEGLTVFPDRMRANLQLTGGLVVTERLAVALAPDLGRTTARRLLTEASDQAARSGRPLGAVLAETPALRDRVDRLRGLLDPTGYTGAAARLVDRALRDH
ncbi:MAG TPA: 3-carboxy-cis,cis-muconate cycloisomerase [Pseudonocardiaceae bacterium]|nr:3-carboxy-cis,cis-muconate cycloisomerase [Pseudonocardiaceae bacterium]